MIQKIDTDKGREIYSKRMGLIEPVFANIRSTLRLDRFSLRDKIKVNIQWLLFCITHNLGKINDTAYKGAKTQRKGQERAKRSEIERKTKTFRRRILSRLFKKYEGRIDFFQNDPFGENGVLQTGFFYGLVMLKIEASGLNKNKRFQVDL